MNFLRSFGKRKMTFCSIIFLAFGLMTSLSLASPNRIDTIDKLNPQKNMAIDDIGNFDSDDSSEVAYIGNNSIYVIDSKDQREEISSGGSFRDVEGFHKWDTDIDADIFWDYYNGDNYRTFSEDHFDNKITVTGRRYFYESIKYSYGNFYEGKGLFFHFDDISNYGSVREGANLYFIPKGKQCGKLNEDNYWIIKNCPYQIYNSSFNPWLPNGLAVSDLDNDNESELIGIQEDNNLVWYNFYNSSENHLGNALELMDETYDVDGDGFEEVFYVDPQNNLSWIDINRENRTTSIKASKLGGVGNWDQDGFKELSFIDLDGNVKIFDLYQLLAMKSVLSDRIGLNQEITIRLKIDNHRRKEALNISISDTIPRGFRPLSKDMKVNISKGNKTHRVEAILVKKEGDLTLSVTHLDSALLGELDSEEKLSISYSLITPQIPGSYTIPGAKVYWLEF